jgi:hypothetical protein
MNHSIITADRNTHLKVVTLALLASVVVAVIGVRAGADTTTPQTRGASVLVVKAGNPVMITSRDGSQIR